MSSTEWDELSRRWRELLTQQAELALRERAKALTGIADPKFRDELSAAARQMALI